MKLFKKLTKNNPVSDQQPVDWPASQVGPVLNKRDGQSPVLQTLALLIPAHNEELVLQDTILGAMKAGIDAADIYVVNDSSTDGTLDIALSCLGADNVLTVDRLGKAGAIARGVDYFGIEKKYGWLQILDADSIFSPDYFSYISLHFKPGIAAVCGQTKSLKNNWITSFRAYEYTISHDFYKSLMGLFNVITIMPGPASCFSTSILKELSFATDTLTEDFDLTLQIHHKKLGRIAYEHRAHSWTQDPFSLSGYIQQVRRWYTGFFQVTKKHGTGFKSWKAVDIVLTVLALDGLLFAVQLMALLALTLLGIRLIDPLFLLASDLLIMIILVGYASIRNRRFDILAPAPLYLFLRVLNLSLFFYAALSIYLRPQKNSKGVWNTGRQTNTELLAKGGVS